MIVVWSPAMYETNLVLEKKNSRNFDLKLARNQSSSIVKFWKGFQVMVVCFILRIFLLSQFSFDDFISIFNENLIYN